MPSSRKPLTTVQSSAGKLHADIATASSQLFPEGAGQEALLGFLNAVAQREVAYVKQTASVAASGQVNFDLRAVETDPIWVGDNPGDDIRDLFQVVDENGSPLKILATTSVTVTGITGPAIGDGFTTGAITIDFSSALPVVGTFRIWYAVRRQTATIEKDADTAATLRHTRRIDSVVLQQRLEELHAASGQVWADPWDSTVKALAAAGLNERYRRQTTVPASFTYDTPGDGRVITRDGLAPMVEAGRFTSENYTNGFVEPTMAHWLSEVEGDDIYGGSASVGSSGGTGFFSVASIKHVDDLNELGKKAYTAGSHVTAALRNLVANDINGVDVRTRVEKVVPCTLNPTSQPTSDAKREIDVTAANFFVNGSGNTELSVGADLVKITFTGPLAARVPEIYVVTDILSPTRVRVRSMSGGRAEFSGAAVTDCTLQVLKMAYHEGGGAAGFFAHKSSHADPVQLDSAIYHAVLPSITDNPLTGNEYLPKAARFLAAARTATEYSHIGAAAPKALEWGGFDPTLTTPQVFLGALRGDGGLDASILKQGVKSVTVNTDPTTTTWHPGLEGAVLYVQFTHAAGLLNWTLALDANYDPADGEMLEVFLVPAANAPPVGTADVSITWPKTSPRGFAFGGDTRASELFINQTMWIGLTYIPDVAPLFFASIKNIGNQVIAARSFRTMPNGLILSGGGAFTWRPMAMGGYIELDLQDTNNYTMNFTAEGTDWPRAGAVIYIEVLQTLVAGGTISWPGNFTFSGADAAIPPAVGDRVLYRGLYTPSNDWLLTRTDY